MEKIRNSGIDLIKCIAVFFVIAVHFFLYTGFYETVMQGKEMFVSTFLRWMFYTCVPLFLIATGYLMRKKELTTGYYKNILKIIIAYIIISILCIFVRIYYLHDGLTWIQGIRGIVRFQTDAYSWYIEMYIGLFLLIPDVTQQDFF